MQQNNFEVIIIGGSYSGLSAAMALGRALRKVLLIDSGKPCNQQTAHSHNFLTQDGKTPSEISNTAKEQVLNYDTISFSSGLVTTIKQTKSGFDVYSEDGKIYQTRKIILATGVKDIMPEIPGFAECWGISIIHCPYCHGYEVRNEKTGILANGDFAYEFGKMIHHWTKELTLFTNGKSTLSEEQSQALLAKGININETELEKIVQTSGKIDQIQLKDGSSISLTALYAKVAFEQSPLAKLLDLKITTQNFIEVDIFQKTNVPGIFACGDATNMFRSVSQAVSSGTMAGAACNKELIDADF